MDYLVREILLVEKEMEFALTKRVYLYALKIKHVLEIFATQLLPMVSNTMNQMEESNLNEENNMR